MVKVIYLLSDQLDYGRLICSDAGPDYATSMCWDVAQLSAYEQIESSSVVVVDNRIQENELTTLKSIINDNPGRRFFLKIVDPYYEHRDQPYYKFLFESAVFSNVNLLSVYQPAELTLELSKLYNHRFIHLPYPYIKANEIINNASRKNKIVISGAMNKAIYPYRYQIWLKATRSLSRIFLPILKHPGYAEFDSTEGHLNATIKSAYTQYLANFKFMLLCPSRCGIEFLKFNECAYAGCIPVGTPPNFYPSEIKELFIDFERTHFYMDLFKILLKKHNTNSVQKLREYLYMTRNPDILNHRFEKFILENTLYST